jgi:hypothetical protein
MLRGKQTLPDDIRFDEYGYFRYVDNDLSKEDSW